MRSKVLNPKRAAKNGKARRKQRFRFKEYGFNFVEGNAKANNKTITAHKTTLILLHSMVGVICL